MTLGNYNILTYFNVIHLNILSDNYLNCFKIIFSIMYIWLQIINMLYNSVPYAIFALQQLYVLSIKY